MRSSTQVLFPALGLVVCGALLAAACGASDEKRDIRQVGGGGGEGGAGAPSMAGSGYDTAAGASGDGGNAMAPTGVSARDVLGLPTALALPVVCGSPSAGVTLSVFNDSEASLTIDDVSFDGPFALKTKLPLTVEPGRSQALEISTPAGVVGTDKPGDERVGSLSVVTSIGSVSVAVLATVEGTTVSVDGIPGAPLTGPIAFDCVSTGDTCPTHTFNVVNTGTSPLKLSAPVGKTAVVAAFVPGSAELTLQPGAAVKVEVRAAAGGSATEDDLLELAVEGSCEVSKLSVATSVVSNDPCACSGVAPGIEAGRFDQVFACGEATTFEVPLFNGTTADLVVTEVDVDGDVSLAPGQLPLTLDHGKTTWLELLAPAYPTGSTSARLDLTTDGGLLRAFGSLQGTGSRLRLLNAQGLSLSSPVALPCASTVLQLWNDGDVAATVAPPVLGGGVATDFVAPQTIEPGTSFTFHVSPVSNGNNDCAATGSIALSGFQNDCAGAGITVNTTYSGACSCDGL